MPPPKKKSPWGRISAGAQGSAKGESTPESRRNWDNPMYEVDPQDPRQNESLAYPHTVASEQEATREDEMATRPNFFQRRYINRTPDINQPVPRYGMKKFDDDEAFHLMGARSVAPRIAGEVASGKKRGLKNVRMRGK